MLQTELTKGCIKAIPLFSSLKISSSLASWQYTLGSPATCTGIGVHSGKPVTLTLCPASPDTGYLFVRTDITSRACRIPARWDTVTDTSLCTKISNAEGVSVSTIEHLIAALAGAGAHNALIKLDGPEVPIMDGSSADFMSLIEEASLQRQPKKARKIRVLKPVSVQKGNAHATLSPSDEPQFHMHFDANGRLANQKWSLSYYPERDNFKDLLSEARTFGFFEDATYLRAQGLAQGASLDNTVVIQEGEVMNEEGLRFCDEFVRHKMLDAFGDLALAGAPLVGHFSGVNSGHALNNQLLRMLFADDSAWCFEDIF